MPGKPEIVLLEDHHQALEVWRKENYKSLPLVHLDAHIDFGFYQAKPAKQALGEAKTLADLKRQLEATLLYQKYNASLEKQLNIGNYIYPAIRDGIVNQFYWIIPGREKEFVKSKKSLKRFIRSLLRQDPYRENQIIVKKQNISAVLYKHPFAVSSLFFAPVIDESLLLDVDVDYLLFSSIRKEHISMTKNIGRRKPWMYPKELVMAVKKKFPRAKCITIAYSVNGGFTPLEYKYFGDEIYLRLKGMVDGQLEDVFSLRDKGIDAYFKIKGKQKLAKTAFREALKKVEKQIKLPSKFRSRLQAHLHFWMFKVLWSLRQKKEAKCHYQEALLADPTYRARDNNDSPRYLSVKKLKLAERELRKIIYCDKKDVFALGGLGQIYLRRNVPKAALVQYSKALVLKPQNTEALLGWADCKLRLHQLSGAEKVLQMLRRKEPFNGWRFLLEARLAKEQGKIEEALFTYKEALLCGVGRKDVFREILKALKLVPGSPLRAFFLQKYASFNKNLVRRNKQLRDVI